MHKIEEQHQIGNKEGYAEIRKENYDKCEEEEEATTREENIVDNIRQENNSIIREGGDDMEIRHEREYHGECSDISEEVQISTQNLQKIFEIIEKFCLAYFVREDTSCCQWTSEEQDYIENSLKTLKLGCERGLEILKESEIQNSEISAKLKQIKAIYEVANVRTAEAPNPKQKKSPVTQRVRNAEEPLLCQEKELLQKMLKEKIRETEKFREMHVRQQREIKTKEVEIRDLTAKMSAMAEEYRQNMASFKQKKQSELKLVIYNKNSTIQRLQSEHDRLKTSLDKEKSKLEKLLKAKEDTRRSVSNMACRVQNLEEKVEELNENNSKMEKELKYTIKQNDALVRKVAFEKKRADTIAEESKSKGSQSSFHLHKYAIKESFSTTKESFSTTRIEKSVSSIRPQTANGVKNTV